MALRHIHLLFAAALSLRLVVDGVSAVAAGAGAGAFDPSRVVQLSWRPR
jgi:prolyl 4-hydroxylase